MPDVRNFYPGRHTALRLLLIAALAIALLWAASRLPFAATFSRLLDSIAAMGPWGPVLLVLAYVAACMFAIPVWPLTLGAGFLFGLLWGIVTVSIGSTIGATMAFLLSRYVARGWVARRMAAQLAFRTADEAIARQGFKIVLLLRLSPAFPFNVLNFALGLTAVPLKWYVLASWLGMLPGTLMYVYLGTAARSVRDVLTGETQLSQLHYVAFSVGLVATILTAIVLARIARDAIRAASSTEEESA